VSFSIQDRGCGIEERDLARLFEPFYTRKSGGTGLGLFVCHGIVQRHGGHIQVQSRPNEGARFTVALPRFPALMGASHEAEHSHR
jgi:two-component system NtrC family sensor kinase